MVEKRSKDAKVRQEVQKRYQAELLRYKRQIEKNKEIFEKGKPR
ncbi:MAG TPA: hypothetical protein V6C86_25290 [Oculatellaceae cyanobacterium]